MKDKDSIKNRIIEATKEKLIKYGYKKVNLDLIASELKISKRTIYENFNSKDDLILEILNEIMNDYRNKIKFLIDELDKSANNFLDEVKKIWEIMSEHISFFTNENIIELRQLSFLISNKCTNIDDERKEYMYKFFINGVKKGYFNKNVNFEILYEIYHNSIKSLLNGDFLRNNPLTPQNVLEEIFLILFLGIMTDNGKKEFNQKFNKIYN